MCTTSRASAPECERRPGSAPESARSSNSPTSRRSGAMSAGPTAMKPGWHSKRQFRSRSSPSGSKPAPASASPKNFGRGAADRNEFLECNSAGGLCPARRPPFFSRQLEGGPVSFGPIRIGAEPARIARDAGGKANGPAGLKQRNRPVKVSSSVQGGQQYNYNCQP